MMELRHLRYFVAVAEELHFGRAAARLGISQPPLSQQLRALEAELGAALLERTSRRVRLTDAGRLFLVEARRLLAQADRAGEIVRRAQRGEVGELAIGLAPSAPLVPSVASALFRFRQSFPGVTLRLAELSRDEQIAAIADHRLDLGFVRGFDQPLLPEGLTATLFHEEEVVIAMRHDHPLAVQRAPIRLTMLAGEPIVLYQQRLGAGFNERFSRLCQEAGFELLVAQEVTGVSTLLGLVAAGFGLTVITRSLAALQLETVVYRPLADPGAVSRLYLIHRKDRSPVCGRFLELAQTSA